MKKFVFSFFLLLLLLSSGVIGEEKYSREHSEELFHLIEWRNYTPDAFAEAQSEQKPIFLMISAPSWCYWCHVYESEDYLYDKNLYPFINENFIPIFVDSDKRPDLTRKYLEGGWPSTTIFAPDMQRIIGFVGPRDPKGLLEYFEQLIEYLSGKDFAGSMTPLAYENTTPRIPQLVELARVEQGILAYLLASSDEEFGGFVQKQQPSWRDGQKFPTAFMYKLLLEEYARSGDERYLFVVKTVFDNQYTHKDELETRYRLFDPIEGGFHRYSTNRDWTTPHYEKMLYDQAKFIRAYAHLLVITNDSDVKNAVDLSIDFVNTKLQDPNGGFSTSQDAYLEEEYYGLPAEQREQIEPPFIDRTRRTDANAMMISTFLYLHTLFDDRGYDQVARENLAFLMDKLVGKDGAFTYYDDDQEKAFLTGQSIANSWALLSLVDAYEVLGDEKFARAARKLADKSLLTLYDWEAGGFFERNSKDTQFYAPGERVDLSKPYEENAVFSYAMLRLYRETGELTYLESGMKTLGYLLDKNGAIDTTYYFIQSARLVKGWGLIQEYRDNEEEISTLVEKRRKTFFLPKLLNEGTGLVSIDDAPKLRDEFLDVGFLALALLAFLAGMLSFLSPCCLPVLTAFFANGANANEGETIKRTILFFLGLALVFSLFGMGATLLGAMLRDYRPLLTKFAGLAIILFGLMEISGRGFSGIHLRLRGGHKTPIGSFLFGAVFAIGWSACIGPILASLLLVSATTGSAFKGSALLFIYALGLALPLILISTRIDWIRRTKLWGIMRGKTVAISIFGRRFEAHSISLITGILLIVIGWLIFNDYLYQLNKFALQTNFVQNVIIGGEEWLKNLIVR